MDKLSPGFYNRTDVVKIAKELIGKILVTHFGGHLTAGRIVETEAYRGEIDKASHAYGGRRTSQALPILVNLGAVRHDLGDR